MNRYDAAEGEHAELRAILRKIPAESGRSISTGSGWYPLLVELDQRLAEIDPARSAGEPPRDAIRSGTVQELDQYVPDVWVHLDRFVDGVDEDGASGVGIVRMCSTAGS